MSSVCVPGMQRDVVRCGLLYPRWHGDNWWLDQTKKERKTSLPFCPLVTCACTHTHRHTQTHTRIGIRIHMNHEWLWSSTSLFTVTWPVSGNELPTPVRGKRETKYSFPFWPLTRAIVFTFAGLEFCRVSFYNFAFFTIFHSYESFVTPAPFLSRFVFGGIFRR